MVAALPRPRSFDDGFTLVELLAVLAILGLFTSVVLPPLLSWSSRQRVELAAIELAATLRQARAWAVRHSRKVALHFETESDRRLRTGRVSWALYRDGDGDGVRRSDIESGVDPLVQASRDLSHLGHGVDFGFPPGPAPRDPGDPGRRLDRLSDPIRFNRSDLASFDPFGGATPGSLYVTDHRHHLYAVRLENRAGRVRVLRWDPAQDRWIPR